VLVILGANRRLNFLSSQTEPLVTKSFSQTWIVQCFNYFQISFRLRQLFHHQSKNMKVTAIVVGAGQRGQGYCGYATDFPDELQVVFL